MRGGGACEGGLQNWIAKQFALLDRLRDAGEILVDQTTRAQMHVAYFGVAHLLIGQADSQARTFKQTMRTFRQHTIPLRGIRGFDRVEFEVIAVAPAIEDYEQCGMFECRHDLAVSTVGYAT